MAIAIQRRALWRAFAVVSLAMLLLTTLAINRSGMADAADYPGQAEIQAAKAAISDAKADVAGLDAAIAELEAAAHAADAAARLAADEYAEAKATSEAAQAELKAANERAEAAQVALEAARSELAQVAMDAYRDGGGFGSLEAIMSADGFEDVVARSEAADRASVHADDTVQRVKAAELVAQTMQDYAERAAEEAAAAEAAAAAALAAAQEAQRNADAALADAEASREEAIGRLAQLRRTSVELERQRQAGLAQERQEEEQRAWEAAQQAAQGGEGTTGGDGSTGGDGTGGTGDPTTSPSTAPTTAPPTTAPPTTPPVTPPAAPTGAWKSTAAQGQTAVNHALTLMGTPYQLGGEGPAYDCSGLTKVSWGVAGFYLPHSSRSQYAAVTKISYSELRPGDLIFWGTGKDATRIYHVAMYIGGGKVAEASTPGVAAKTRVYNNWAVGDLMPYAGRV